MNFENQSGNTYDMKCVRWPNIFEDLDRLPKGRGKEYNIIPYTGTFKNLAENEKEANKN